MKTAIILGIVFLFTAKSSAEPTTRPATRPVEPMPNGILILHARDVTVHGTKVRYEPQPFKNTVGYWMNQEDWVSWEFSLKTPGKYHVVVFQGCGKGSGGSEVEFAFGEQKLKMTVEETGALQTFKERHIGTLSFEAGRGTLTVKPLSKPGLAVMDLHAVELIPAE